MTKPPTRRGAGRRNKPSAGQRRWGRSANGAGAPRTGRLLPPAAQCQHDTGRGFTAAAAAATAATRAAAAPRAGALGALRPRWSRFGRGGGARTTPTSAPRRLARRCVRRTRAAAVGAATTMPDRRPLPALVSQRSGGRGDGAGPEDAGAALTAAPHTIATTAWTQPLPPSPPCTAASACPSRGKRCQRSRVSLPTSTAAATLGQRHRRDKSRRLHLFAAPLTLPPPASTATITRRPTPTLPPSAAPHNRPALATTSAGGPSLRRRRRWWLQLQRRPHQPIHVHVVRQGRVVPAIL